VSISPLTPSLTAGDAGVTLSAAATPDCASCTYAWALDAGCPVYPGKGTSTGKDWPITAGLAGSEVVNTTGVTAAFSCSATVTSTDEYEATSTATVTLQVNLPPAPTYQFTSADAAPVKVGESVVVAVDTTTGYTCPATGCGPATWAISGAGCSGAALDAGNSVTVTANAGSTFSIDTSAITVAGLTCTLEATITDAYKRAIKQAKTVVVRRRALHVGRQGRMHMAGRTPICIELGAACTRRAAGSGMRGRPPTAAGLAAVPQDWHLHPPTWPARIRNRAHVRGVAAPYAHPPLLVARPPCSPGVPGGRAHHAGAACGRRKHHHHARQQPHV
jgi:hypothetical protein